MKGSPFPAGPCMVSQGQVFEGGKAIKGRQTAVFHSQLSTIVHIDLCQNNHLARPPMTTRDPTMELQSNLPYTDAVPSHDRASCWLRSWDPNSDQVVKVLPGNYRIDFDGSRPTEQLSITACDRDLNDRTNVEPILLTCQPLERDEDLNPTARLVIFPAAPERDDRREPLEGVYGIELSHNATAYVSVTADGQIEEPRGDDISCDPLYLNSRGTIPSTRAPPSIPHRQQP